MTVRTVNGLRVEEGRKRCRADKYGSWLHRPNCEHLRPKLTRGQAASSREAAKRAERRRQRALDKTPRGPQKGADIQTLMEHHSDSNSEHTTSPLNGGSAVPPPSLSAVGIFIGQSGSGWQAYRQTDSGKRQGFGLVYPTAAQAIHETRLAMGIAYDPSPRRAPVVDEQHPVPTHPETPERRKLVDEQRALIAEKDLRDGGDNSWWDQHPLPAWAKAVS
jgi:hypothetical protein